MDGDRDPDAADPDAGGDGAGNPDASGDGAGDSGASGDETGGHEVGGDETGEPPSRGDDTGPPDDGEADGSSRTDAEEGSAGWGWHDEGDGDGSPDRRIVAPLRLAAREHRPHVLFSAALFALGVVVGAAMVGRVDLFAALGVEDASQLFPENITAATILFNNTRAAVVLVLGALSLGVVTAIVLVFNGVLVGYVAGAAAAERGIGVVLLAIVPHGIVELPAIFVAGAVAFRVVHVTALRVVGRRDVVLGRDGWRRTGLLLGATWTALVVAAIVEFHVTTRILEAAGAA